MNFKFKRLPANRGDETSVSDTLVSARRNGSARFEHLRLIGSNKDRSLPMEATPGCLNHILLDAIARRGGQLDEFSECMALAILALDFADQTSSNVEKGRRGKLELWQLESALRMLGDSSNNVPIVKIAGHCGISPSYFCRAFRMTTNFSPRRWRLNHRVNLSKAMLRDSDMSLADIAGECGFSEQSHFNHVFTRLVGVSPGVWRKTWQHSGDQMFSQPSLTERA